MNEDELGEALREELHGLSRDLHPSPGLMRRLNEIPDNRRRRPARRWLLAPAGALAAAIVAVLVIVAVGSRPPAAIAFTVAGGKTVHVTVQDIQDVNPANTKLKALGRVRAIAMTATCQTPTSDVNYQILREFPTPRISLGNPQTGYSGTEIVAAKQISANRIIVAIGTVTGKVPPCVSSKGTGPGFPGWKPNSNGPTGSTSHVGAG